MKKILFAITMVLFTFQSPWAMDDTAKNKTKLPEQAQQFIQQHFPNTGIAYIKGENELFKGKKYEVVLTNGTEIDFDSKGNWTEIDCKNDRVPDALLPDYVKKYLTTNFNGEYVTQIERIRYNVEVELSNDLDLTFNKSGKLIKIDN